MNSLIFTCSCVVAMIFLAGSEAAIITLPRNTMALANARVEFQCSTDSNKSLQWSVTYRETKKTIALFTRGNFTSAGESNYRINKTIDGQYNLIIDSANLSSAGKYKCSEGSFGTEGEAELAIIDAQPLCQANASIADKSVAENDYLRMNCSLNFSGSVNLSMSWTRKTSRSVPHNTVDYTNQSVRDSAGNRAQSVIVIQVNCSDNNETFTFTSTFTQENNSVPTVISWNYTVKVLCTTTTSSGSSAALIGSVLSVTLLCTVIIVLFCRRVIAKAWASRHCVLTAESEPDVVRTDPINHDNSYYYEIEDLSNEGATALTVISRDDSVTSQVQPSFAIYELVGGEDNGQERGNHEKQTAPPQSAVYSEVAKTSPVLTTHHGSNTSGLQSTTRAANTPQTNYFGSDGTEYTEVNSFGERPVAPTPNSSKFHPVEKYAMIDHTRRAPPPLPRL